MAPKSINERGKQNKSFKPTGTLNFTAEFEEGSLRRVFQRRRAGFDRPSEKIFVPHNVSGCFRMQNSLVHLIIMIIIIINFGGSLVVHLKTRILLQVTMREKHVMNVL